jgi:hypothetical protein
MDQFKALHATHGDGITDVLRPTKELCISILVKNKDAILAIKPRTEQYGSHPRQKLDVYSSSTSDPQGPILVFLYGGGLIFGDKIDPTVSDGLIYHNFGTFFASRGIGMSSTKISTCHYIIKDKTSQISTHM